MTIKVQANHKYIDEIQSVAQIFFPHARFGSDDTPGYTISSFFDNGKVHAAIFNESMGARFAENSGADVVHLLNSGEHTPPLRVSPLGEHSLDLSSSPSFLNEKRMAMLAMYRLLQRVIGAYTPWGALTGVRPTKMVREWIGAGQPDEEILQNLQNILHVHESRARLAVAVAHAENRLATRINSAAPSYLSPPEHTHTINNAIPAQPLGLYISIPFCPSRCIYCSFNTSSGSWNEQAQTQYVHALISECKSLAAGLEETGQQISSIYIGGGTPTALTDTLLETLLSTVQEMAVPGEYTVEAGRPDTITRANLQIMRKYNVNRISINPQTLNDKTLKTIGRNHTTKDFLRAFEEAREEGFTSINTDIIAGLPGEGPKDMHRTMETLANLSPENITIHTLAVKRASKLNQHRTDIAIPPLNGLARAENRERINVFSATGETDLKVNCYKTSAENRKHSITGLAPDTARESLHPAYALPDPKSIESQLKIAHDACTAMGLIPYYLYRQKNMAALFENTGYSLPGHECLYNIGMMSEVQTVLGIGAGAVSKYVEGTKITRKFNVKNPEIYIQRI
ncbi:MAG: coproporphyrinogen dehydrogenase HemZ [Defluviitaleaceae bacterium]|nr:coproporphyrinogen dehydrogenase HemZ [Defluviitaleaceae bacterium]